MAAETLVLVGQQVEKQERRNPRGVYQKFPGKDSPWWICYWDAQRRRRREKAGTKSAAIELSRKRKHEALEGKKLPEKLRRTTVSFAEIAKDALEYSKLHKRQHRDDVSRMPLVLEWFGAYPAEAVTSQEIEARITRCAEDRGWAASNVNHYRSLLSLVFRRAIRNGKVRTNPVRDVPNRREDNSRVRFLDPAEEKRLRAVLEANHAEYIPEFDLALNTGLRRTDMHVRLTWDRVNMDLRLATIPRSKNKEPHHVRLNKSTLAALEIFRSRGDGTGRVVCMRKAIRSAATTIGFGAPCARKALRISTGMTRHTGASRLLMRGANLRAVQEFLGHRSLAMTTRYAHLSRDYQLGVVELLEELAATSPLRPFSEETARVN